MVSEVKNSPVDEWHYFWEGFSAHREASKPLYRESDEPIADDPYALAFWNPYYDALRQNREHEFRAEEWWLKGWRDREREVSGRRDGERQC